VRETVRVVSSLNEEGWLSKTQNLKDGRVALLRYRGKISEEIYTGSAAEAELARISFEI